MQDFDQMNLGESHIVDQQPASLQQPPRVKQTSVSVRLWRGVGLLFCAILGMLAGNLWIDARAPGPETIRGVSDDDAVIRFGRLFRQRFSQYHAAEVGKNHQRIKSAFQETVRLSHPSTVRVISRGKQLAMGTIVRSDGLVLTKASELAEPLMCQIPSGETLAATVLTTDADSDLALLQLDAASLPSLQPVEFVDASPHLGDWLAVPGGGDQKPLVVGVVSSLPRKIPRHQGLLGVFLSETRGAVSIEYVIPDSTAERHGLQSGDVVVAANGQPILRRMQLQQLIAQALPGDEVGLTLRRGEQEIPKTVTLGRRPADGGGFEHADPEHEGGPLSRRRSGFSSIIQHDCPLAPNQCGGPLVNVDGEVIGINIARASRIESYALPSTIVLTKLEQMLADSTSMALNP